MDLDHDLNTFKNGVDPGEHILNADPKQCSSQCNFWHKKYFLPAILATARGGGVPGKLVYLVNKRRKLNLFLRVLLNVLTSNF